jgi:lipoprotein LpqH
MEKRRLTAVGVATILLAGSVGCSSNDTSSSTSSAKGSTSTSASSAATSSSESETAAAGPASATVTVDGQPRPVDGPVTCQTMDGKFSIAIGEVITGVIVGLEPDASTVHGVGLGDVNGVVLNFTEGVPGDTATATKDGNTYTVTGAASGVDAANKPVSKPFEIVATCP